MQPKVRCYLYCASLVEPLLADVSRDDGLKSQFIFTIYLLIDFFSKLCQSHMIWYHLEFSMQQTSPDLTRFQSRFVVEWHLLLLWSQKMQFNTTGPRMLWAADTTYAIILSEIIQEDNRWYCLQCKKNKKQKTNSLFLAKNSVNNSF